MRCKTDKFKTSYKVTIVEIFCIFILLGAVPNAAYSEDKTSERIRGVSSFLLKRANDNFLYLVETRIKDNELLKCYFPNTYKYVATGDFISLLRGKNIVWEEAVEKDIQSITEILVVQLYSQTVSKFYNEYLTALNDLSIEIDGKLYPINRNVLPTEPNAERVNAIINEFYSQDGTDIFSYLYDELKKSQPKDNQYKILYRDTESRFCAYRTDQRKPTKTASFSPQARLSDLETRVDMIAKSVNQLSVTDIKNKLSTLQQSSRGIGVASVDKQDARLMAEVRGLENIVSSHERYDEVLNWVNSVKMNTSRVGDVRDKAKQIFQDKKQVFSKYAKKLYRYSPATGVAKPVGKQINELIEYLDKLEDYDRYYEYIKRKLPSITNPETGFLVKVRKAEEILLCGAKDRIPTNYDTSLLDCAPDERVQLFNIDFDSEDYARFRRYFVFFAEVADADDANKVEVLLSDLTLPPVSYGLKRNKDGREFSISSYLGLAVASEDTLNEDSQYLGIFAPIGLEWTFYKWSQQSLSVMVAPFDLAHPINLEIEGKTSAVSLDDIVIPGIYLTYGWRDSPLAIGIGYSKGRAIRSEAEEEKRYLVYFALDMPLF